MAVSSNCIGEGARRRPEVLGLMFVGSWQLIVSSARKQQCPSSRKPWRSFWQQQGIKWMQLPLPGAARRCQEHLAVAAAVQVQASTLQQEKRCLGRRAKQQQLRCLPQHQQQAILKHQFPATAAAAAIRNCRQQGQQPQSNHVTGHA